MKKDSIIFMLRSHGVKDEHIELFNQLFKNKTITVDDCDRLLEKLNYDKLFVIDEEEDDYYEYVSFEEKKVKKTFEKEKSILDI